MANLPRTPHDQNPKDPTWKYPYESRYQIKALERYFSTFHERPKGWYKAPDKRSPDHRAGEVAWSRVMPHLRPQVQEWFERKIAEYKASGRKLTDGKIRSLRCNASYYGRHLLTKRHQMRAWVYYSRRAKWNKYQKWLTEQQRKEFAAKQSPLPHRQLEIA